MITKCIPIFSSKTHLEGIVTEAIAMIQKIYEKMNKRILTKIALKNSSTY